MIIWCSSDSIFPRAGSRIRNENQKLQSKFNVTSFPTVLLNDSDGNRISRFQGYGNHTPEEYVYRLKEALKN